ncbi:MAG: MotA/TolQ/ExbB proton channel family protein [Verrucomicrobiales bacterium]|nr:MotA/TolQ/ExbB proton channel family protein [Verrucomicrobiales bacterium]
MWEFLKAGGPFMILLVLTSVVGLAFIIERGLALRWGRVIPPKLEFALENCRTREDLLRLVKLCAEPPSPLGRLIIVTHDHLPSPREENVDAIQTRARHEVLQLERGLVVLEVVVGIAPLLGLVGTIHGLITLFGDLGAAGLADNAVLAKGIAIALNTTLMGLLIAIPSLVAWSYYTKKVETLAVEMETLCDEFLRRQYRTGSRS